MDRYKPKKYRYYLFSYIREMIPGKIWQAIKPDFDSMLKNDVDAADVLERVSYYNKLSSPFLLPENAIRLKDLWKVHSSSMYKHDTWRTSRWFDGHLKWVPDFGDVNWISGCPSIAKSRPVNGDNRNNVLLKLDRCRHFNFINDKSRLSDKAGKAVFMADIGDTGKLNRVRFMEKYFGSDICDCGSIRNLPGLPKEWLKPKMKIREMLEYKFILALEGNDVATNLKWIMSSNSLAVMPKPTCETWFMEATLKPDFHYVEISPDFSDLKEKIDFYNRHSGAAEKIIHNAHEYIRKFTDSRKEDLTEYLVMLKYLCLSGQIEKGFIL